MVGIFQRARFCLLLCALVCAARFSAPSQTVTAGSSTNTVSSKEQQLVSLQLEMTNAYNRVLAIVNRSVPAYVRQQGMRVSVSSPGWFHEGATKPDFNTVDIRQSQDLHYAQNDYATSDLNPGIVFRGADIEFNSMTKWFYTNLSLPKRRLTEPEMLEINRLYRVVGRCETEINQLQPPPSTTEIASVDGAAPVAEGEVLPGQQLEAIRKIPRETRMLYGGIGIGALLLLAVALRIFRRR